jgi:hypothetical protein
LGETDLDDVGKQLSLDSESQRNFQKGYCFKYNADTCERQTTSVSICLEPSGRNMTFDACPALHVCSRCRGPHPQHQCTVSTRDIVVRTASVAF